MKILKKPLIKFGNSRVIVIPNDWLTKREGKEPLLIGNRLDMIVTKHAIIILDGDTEFDEKIIIETLKLAKQKADVQDAEEVMELQHDLLMSLPKEKRVEARKIMEKDHFKNLRKNKKK